MCAIQSLLLLLPLQVGGTFRTPGDHKEPLPSPQAHPQPERIGQELAVGGREVGPGLGGGGGGR